MSPSLPQPRLCFGLDLGRQADHSALVLLERNSVPDGFDRVYLQPVRRLVYVLRYAERLPLGLPYLEVVSRVSSFIDSAAHPLYGRCPLLDGHESPPLKTLAIDATGVGAPVVELFRKGLRSARILSIALTSGQAPSKNSAGDLLLPRRDLLSNLRILLETKALKIPTGLHIHDDLLAEVAELEDAPTARHDDLAFALALAAWAATHP